MPISCELKVQIWKFMPGGTIDTDMKYWGSNAVTSWSYMQYVKYTPVSTINKQIATNVENLRNKIIRGYCLLFNVSYLLLNLHLNI